MSNYTLIALVHLTVGIVVGIHLESGTTDVMYLAVAAAQGTLLVLGGVVVGVLVFAAVALAVGAVGLLIREIVRGY